MGKIATGVGASVCFLAAAVLTVNAFCAASASADTAVRPESLAEQELRAVEAQLAQALSSVDVDQLARLWADDFVSTMVGGTSCPGKNVLNRCASRSRIAPPRSPALTSKWMYASMATGRSSWSPLRGCRTASGLAILIRQLTFGQNDWAGGAWSRRISAKFIREEASSAEKFGVRHRPAVVSAL